MGERELREFIPGSIWTKDYPIRYAGTRFNARMTVVRLSDERLWIHSPCEIDDATRDAIAKLGDVAFIVAPGTYHYFFVESCQRAFPEALTFFCPGLERKRSGLRYDRILGPHPEPEWQGEFDQVPVLDARFLQEVVFFHKATRTLIVVDLIENIGNGTPGTNWVLRFWWKVVLRMWNRPLPAPEYQLGWRNKKAVGRSLARVLEWDFTQVILSHGDPITTDAKAAVRGAWRTPLSAA
jgi:hypothetical protein